MTISLSVKRRIWDILVVGKNLKVIRDLNLLAQANRISAEYATFLKEIKRD